MLKLSHRSRPVSREHANLFLSIARHTNTDNVQLMWAINTLLLYNCMERSISPFRQSHVVNFSRGHVKSIEMYQYTKSTLSQTLTVVQHTVFDLQASKRLFYTYNTVVLLNILLLLLWACLPMLLQDH